MLVPLYVLLDRLHLLNHLARAGARLRDHGDPVLRLHAQGLLRHAAARARGGGAPRRRHALRRLLARGAAAGAPGARGDRAVLFLTAWNEFILACDVHERSARVHAAGRAAALRRRLLDRVGPLRRRRDPRLAAGDGAVLRARAAPRRRAHAGGVKG